MTPANVDDAATSTHTPHASCRLPRFEQFLARQAAGVTDDPGQSIEQRVARKAAEIVIGQPILRRRIEHHPASIEQQTIRRAGAVQGEVLKRRALKVVGDATVLRSATIMLLEQS